MLKAWERSPPDVLMRLQLPGAPISAVSPTPNLLDSRDLDAKYDKRPVHESSLYISLHL